MRTGRPMLALLMLLASLPLGRICAQQKTPSSGASATAPATGRAALLSAARAIMQSARYASLATTAGADVQARIVDPLAPDSNFVVWVATNPASRKVAEVRRSGRATLLYFDPKALEYVTLVGAASVVSAASEKRLHWKAEWDPFYKKGAAGDDVVLLRIQPERLEVVAPARKINNDSITWRPASVRVGSPPAGPASTPRSPSGSR